LTNSTLYLLTNIQNHEPHIEKVFYEIDIKIEYVY